MGAGLTCHEKRQKLVSLDLRLRIISIGHRVAMLSAFNLVFQKSPLVVPGADMAPALLSFRMQVSAALVRREQ